MVHRRLRATYCFLRLLEAWYEIPWEILVLFSFCSGFSLESHVYTMMPQYIRD